MLNCRPATSEHVLYAKDCTNMAHATLIMPLGDGIPASFWRTRENEAKTGMGQGHKAEELVIITNSDRELSVSKSPPL